MKNSDSLALARRSDVTLEFSQSKKEEQRIVEEKAFYDLVQNATRQGVKDTLGPDVVGILESKGFLDNVDDPTEFDRRLTSVFGNGAKVLERLVVKELYQELGIGYNSSTPFNYGDSLNTAKEFYYFRSRVK